MKKEDLRKVEVNSHGFFTTGLFHRWSDIDGETHALIESKDGILKHYPIKGYWFKFID